MHSAGGQYDTKFVVLNFDTFHRISDSEGQLELAWENTIAAVRFLVP